MKTVLTFIIKVDVKHETEKGLREAARDIRENLSSHCDTAGHKDCYSYRSRKAQLVREGVN